jgi:hypothetical protein
MSVVIEGTWNKQLLVAIDDGNATHKVHRNTAYCNQNQWLSIILLQRGEFE